VAPTLEDTTWTPEEVSAGRDEDDSGGADDGVGTDAEVEPGAPLESSDVDELLLAVTGTWEEVVLGSLLDDPGPLEALSSDDDDSREAEEPVMPPDVEGGPPEPGALELPWAEEEPVPALVEPAREEVPPEVGAPVLDPV
jgi:hypothetical protein